MENMRVPEFKALMRERGLRNYSRLRKAELIELIRNEQEPLQSWEPSIPQMGPIPQRTLNRPPQPTRPPPPPPGQSHARTTQTWEPQTAGWGFATQPELEEAPLTKRQLKCRQNKDSKLAKEFERLEADIDNLKSQVGTLKNEIIKESKSTNARFKRKKIRSMKERLIR